MAENQVFELYPIGHIRQSDDGAYLELVERFRPGLRRLAQFSHVIVLWWADRQDNEIKRSIIQTQPAYAPGVVAGVFACRTEFRPNPLGMAVCALTRIDGEKGLVYLDGLTVYDGAPVVDLKGYLPASDSVPEAHIPDWLQEGALAAAGNKNGSSERERSPSPTGLIGS